MSQSTHTQCSFNPSFNDPISENSHSNQCTFIQKINNNTHSSVLVPFKFSQGGCYENYCSNFFESPLNTTLSQESFNSTRYEYEFFKIRSDIEDETEFYESFLDVFQNKFSTMLIDAIKKKIVVKKLFECQTTQSTEDEIFQAVDNLNLADIDPTYWSHLIEKEIDKFYE
jgi:hypothetical protein